MTLRDFVKNINNAWELVDRLNLGLTYSVPGSLCVNNEFRDVAFDRNAKYIDLYKLGLRLKHYNLLLNDYSYFQFSYVDESIRLAYYPCPFSSGNDEFIFDLELQLSTGLIDAEDYQSLLEEAEESQKIPPVRYEYDTDQYKEFLHPCSHFHIGHDFDNRWPIQRVLNPLTFTLIIMKKFYSKKWSEYDDESHAYKNELNEIMAKQKRKCISLPQNLFSQKEAEIFYFL